jgi:ABC-2 type transport system ATP-binding protein
VRELSKEFGTLRALDGVSFTIGRGDVVGLIGPNGAGKTTLLECIAGLLPPDRGSISSAGIGLTGAIRQRTLFYMPDGIVPWEAQPAGWVLEFFEALHGGMSGARESLVGELALAPLLRQPIGTLSRGERKRVLLALGLLTPYPLLLLDEPFDGLDVRQVREVAAILRAHAARGRTLFLSIHQLVDAARVCDRMVLLSGGRVVGTGTLTELRERAGLPDGDLEGVFLALT